MLFSPNSHLLISAGADNTARIWDLTAENVSKSSIVLRGHDLEIKEVAITPDSRRLFTKSFGAPRVWDLHANNPASRSTLRGHTEMIWSLALSRNGRRLVTGSFDGTARVWELNSASSASPLAALRGDENMIGLVRIGSADRWIVALSYDGGDRIAHVWDQTLADPSTSVVLGESDVTCIAISPLGHWIATGHRDGHVRRWDLPLISAASPRIVGRHGGRVSAMEFAPDGRLITASQDGTARLWDLSADKVRSHVLKGHERPIVRIAVSPDGGMLATAGTSVDKTVRIGIWDLKSDEPSSALGFLTTGGMVTTLAISRSIRRNQRWLGVANNAASSLWKLNTSKLESSKQFPLPHGASTLSIAISANCRRAVTGGMDGTAKVWNLEADNPGLAPLVLSGHSTSVRRVAFTPDNATVITASTDNTVRLWETLAITGTVSGSTRTVSSVTVVRTWARKGPMESP